MQLAHDEATRLIARYVEPHPARPGEAEARLRERGVAVWAVVGSYQLAEGTDRVRQVADAYELTADAVCAALAYYEQHREAIDARLAANAA